MNAYATGLPLERRVARAGALVLAIVLALLLNVFLLKGILGLNRVASQRAPEVAARMQTRLVEPPRAGEPEPIEEAVVEDVETPLLLVDLEAPSVELEPLELPAPRFDLQLSPRRFESAGVPVRSEVVLHARAAPAAPIGAPNGPLSADAVDEPPRELASSPKPAYPRMALRRKVAGVVTIELLIDADGRVRETRNVQGDPVLVPAVVAVARELRFAPARHRGSAVAVWGRKSFRFVLPEERP